MPFVIELESDPVYTKGKEKGQMEEKIAIARSLLDILDDKTISQRVGLELEEVKKLREEEENK